MIGGALHVECCGLWRGECSERSPYHGQPLVHHTIERGTNLFKYSHQISLLLPASNEWADTTQTFYICACKIFWQHRRSFPFSPNTTLASPREPFPVLEDPAPFPARLRLLFVNGTSVAGPRAPCVATASACDSPNLAKLSAPQLMPWQALYPL